MLHERIFHNVYSHILRDIMVWAEMDKADKMWRSQFLREGEDEALGSNITAPLIASRDHQALCQQNLFHTFAKAYLLRPAELRVQQLRGPWVVLTGNRILWRAC